LAIVQTAFVGPVPPVGHTADPFGHWLDTGNLLCLLLLLIEASTPIGNHGFSPLHFLCLLLNLLLMMLTKLVLCQTAQRKVINCGNIML
jgi:hypothetical protein